MRRYIQINIDIKALAERGEMHIEVVNWNRLLDDGYEMNSAGKRMFYNFFKKEIFGPDDFERLDKKYPMPGSVERIRNVDIEIQETKDLIQRRMDTFDANHIRTVEQILLQFCGRISDGKEITEERKEENKENAKLTREIVNIREALLLKEKQVDNLEHEKAFWQYSYEKERVEKRKAEIETRRIGLELERTEKELQKRKKRRTLGDRILQLIGIVYWAIWKLDGGEEGRNGRI